jgi:hypothetical protein
VWSTAQVEEALALGTETRSFEVKGACAPSDTGPIGRVVRGVLAMSNIADGGRIAVGIDNASMAAMAPGLSAAQLNAWQKSEPIHDKITKYADPPIGVTYQEHVLSNGVTIVVLEVPGIAGEPHFCKKDLNDPDDGRNLILREGALYVRSIGKPESVEVRTRAAMQEVIESATTYRLRAFVEQAMRAGLHLGTTSPEAAELAYFNEQRQRGFE